MSKYWCKTLYFQPFVVYTKYLAQNMGIGLCYDRSIWPKVCVFLCLQYAKRLWHNQTCIQLKHEELQSTMLKQMKDIVYDSEIPKLWLNLQPYFNPCPKPYLYIIWMFGAHMWITLQHPLHRWRHQCHNQGLWHFECNAQF